MTQSQPGPGPSTGTVSLADEAAVVELVSSSILKLWGAVNDLTQLRPTRRDRFRVTIFGSARGPKDHWGYKAVHDVAAGLTPLHCDIVTGGGPRPMRGGGTPPASIVTS